MSVIIAMHVLVYRRMAVATRLPKAGRIATAVALVVLGLLFLGGLRSLWAPVLSPDAARPLAWVGMTWLALLFYLALGLAVAGVVLLILRRRDEAPRTRDEAPRARDEAPRTRSNRIAAVVVLALAVATTGWGVAQADDPQITHYELASSDLPPELDGTRVVLLSDLHIGAVSSTKFAEEMVKKANAADPDIVVLAGDLIEGDPDRYGDQLAPLAELDAPLGVYAVTGNHEFISGEPQKWIDRWKELGITVLQNESVTTGPDGATIRIAGVHDASAADGFVSDPKAALNGSSPDEFILYVAHQPKQAEDVDGRGIDLQVSGHTHGGQLWPMHGIVLLDQPMLDGQAKVGDVPVITSRGAGTWGPPVRVGAPPEIPVITLTR